MQIKLTIPEVLDMRSGKILDASLVIQQSDAAHHIQRMEDETARLRDKTSRFHCPLCIDALTIRGSQKKQYHFKHPVDPKALCPYRSNHTMSVDEINACKYDGAKESDAHHRLKNWIEQSLHADSNFDPSSIHREKRISGIKATSSWKEWRQPDVQAKCKGQLFVFEIQLSTTFLSVVAGRREFYLKNGACLIWIFDQSMIDSEGMRFMERDIFFNNNRNLFFITKDTVKNSIQLGELRLMCRYEKLFIDEFEIKSQMVELEVGLSELTINLDTQRVFFYDYDFMWKLLDDEIEDQLSVSELIFEDESEGVSTDYSYKVYLEQKAFMDEVLFALNAQPPEVNTRLNFLEYWKLLCIHKSSERAHEVLWKYFAPEFKKRLASFDVPFSPKIRRIVCALLSLKEGKVHGFRYKNLKEIENHIFSKHKEYYRLFAFAIQKFSRTNELNINIPDSTGSKHVEHYKVHKGEPEFAQNRQLDDLVKFLFPEFQ